MNNLYAQYGAIDFEIVRQDGEPTEFHALFAVYGVEATLDSTDWWDAESDMAELGAILYAESRDA